MSTFAGFVGSAHQAFRPSASSTPRRYLACTYASGISAIEAGATISLLSVMQSEDASRYRQKSLNAPRAHCGCQVFLTLYCCDGVTPLRIHDELRERHWTLSNGDEPAKSSASSRPELHYKQRSREKVMTFAIREIHSATELPGSAVPRLTRAVQSRSTRRRA